MTCPFCHHREHLPEPCRKEIDALPVGDGGYAAVTCGCCPDTTEILRQMQVAGDKLSALQREYRKASAAQAAQD